MLSVLNVFAAPFCLKLYQEILQSSNGALLWTFLKPLLHGKILYNSNISMIDLVMEKVSIKRNSVSVYCFCLCTSFYRSTSFSVGRSNWIFAFQKTGSTQTPGFSPCSLFKLNISLNIYPTCYSGFTSVWKAELYSKCLKRRIERLKRAQ